jgi:hypothetical protein
LSHSHPPLTRELRAIRLKVSFEIPRLAQASENDLKPLPGFETRSRSQPA